MLWIEVKDLIGIEFEKEKLMLRLSSVNVNVVARDEQTGMGGCLSQEQE
jgi:hypothetical protein